MTESQKKVVELLSNSMYYETLGNELLSKELIIKLCNEISNMVNSFSFKPQEITEAILADCLARATFKQICLLWIYKLANMTYYDDRNKYSIELSKELIKLDKIKESIDFYLKMLSVEEYDFSKCIKANDIFKKVADTNCPVAIPVVEFMTRDHRTLQQTFSSLVFYFLLNAGGDEQTVLEIFEKEQPMFYSTPLI